jgi:hypothetical protein
MTGMKRYSALQREVALQALIAGSFSLLWS